MNYLASWWGNKLRSVSGTSILHSNTSNKHRWSIINEIYTAVIFSTYEREQLLIWVTSMYLSYPPWLSNICPHRWVPMCSISHMRNANTVLLTTILTFSTALFKAIKQLIPEIRHVITINFKFQRNCIHFTTHVSGISLRKPLFKRFS